MSTRITSMSSISSRRLKQEVVTLLFGHKYSGKGPDAHRKLDPTIYSYSELRTAYLERLQAIHPDKLKHQLDSNNGNSNSEEPSLMESNVQHQQEQQAAVHSRFVELQDAWNKYEDVAKLMQKVGKPEEANFTMFGVGCSFADSPTERALREEITEQACRGWFAAGSLGDTTSDVSNARMESKSVPLVDGDLFTEMTLDTPESGNPKASQHLPPRRSLVPPGVRPKR